MLSPSDSRQRNGNQLFLGPRALCAPISMPRSDRPGPPPHRGKRRSVRPLDGRVSGEYRRPRPTHGPMSRLLCRPRRREPGWLPRVLECQAPGGAVEGCCSDTPSRLGRPQSCDQCLQQLLAISKILVEGAVRHPRLGGEVGDAEPVTLVGEHHHRRIEQQMTGALSLLVATRGGSGQRPHHHPNLIKVDDFVNID